MSDLDRTIHEPARLRILTNLASKRLARAGIFTEPSSAQAFAGAP